MVISSFRNDAEVLALVTRARELAPLFERVIVVDSLGHAGMAERVRVAAADLPAEYISADRNLGAAGNLKERLLRAAATGATYAYALNHDAALDAGVARKLIDVADAHPNAAATYPLRRLTSRGGMYDVSGLSPWPWTSRSTRNLPRERLLPAHWSSSNGALYRLDVVRAGLLPWEELWHGVEDIEYGWRLEAAGYEQFMVSDAIVDDNYEFAPHGSGASAGVPRVEAAVALVLLRAQPAYGVTALVAGAHGGGVGARRARDVRHRGGAQEQGRAPDQPGDGRGGRAARARRQVEVPLGAERGHGGAAEPAADLGGFVGAIELHGGLLETL